MFWKIILALGLVYGAATYFGFMLGGMIHLLPILAVVFWVVRRMAKPQDTEFGRWRAPPPGRDRYL